jgi:Icc protein
MRSIRLLQFSDLHLFGDAAGRLRGVACLPALQAAVSDAFRRNPRLDAILLTGDLVQDDPEGYRWVRHVFGQLNIPVLCLAGNHDLPEQMRATLNASPFVIGGATQFDRWSVVMLDSWIANDASGQIGPKQLAYLEDHLRTHRDQHVIVCVHHHPIRMQSEWLDHVGLRDADEFLGMVRGYPNVRGVLWGHVHQSLDSFIHGVRFMATPATCAQFVPGSAQFAIDNRPPGYRVLDLMPDGTIATEVCWLESYAERIVA